ncbi:hypothetical protein [Streptomyces sp. NPDC101455]|uniref:hypothetical protein n=1 Tax=Streptomyces sp. NPDC101455 TaxID=3366142 RepID=UPI0038168B36
MPTGKAPGNGVATEIGRGPPTADGTKLMLAFVAAVLLDIAFIIHATETQTDVIFSSTSLLYFGLTLLALRVAVVGTGWSGRGRSRRR